MKNKEIINSSIFEKFAELFCHPVLICCKCKYWENWERWLKDVNNPK